MYRKQISQKASPSIRTKPISKEISPSPSYGSLSSVVQRVQQDPNSVSEDERQQLESAIGSRSTQEILAGKQTPWVPEFQGISVQLWGNSKQVGAPIQAKEKDDAGASEVQSENKTGLPDNLKAGIENLSGYSLDDVRVHYNSPKPAQLQALAYTQGTEIHVAPGQEQHLPHEAWHVVQQKQGRVKPTIQAKGVAINDDQALEREADVMGDQILDNKETKPQESLVFNGNRSNAIQNKSIQFFQILDGTYKSLLINQYKNHKGWTKERLEELTEWANSYNQIKSILGKMSYDDWNSIRVAYPDSKHLNQKIDDPDKLLDPELTRKGEKPTVEELRGYSYHWAKKANPVEQNQDLKTLIANQRKYETVISQVNKEDGTSILDKHRTMGIELEFAYYDNWYGLHPHTELAVSDDSILQSVPGEWVLETDSNEKLEIGVPPMYVIDIETGEINIKVITAIRQIVKTALETVRDKYKNSSLVKDFVAEMPNQGLGKNWKKKPVMSDYLAFKGRTSYTDAEKEIVEENLGLNNGKKDTKYMYEQINLSMTAKEIAQDIEKQKTHESKSRLNRDYDWLGVLAGEILNYLNIYMDDKGLVEAKVLMSKGLAGIAALPDILAPTPDGVHSSIKEIFGIWVKDNTPNLVVSAAIDSENGLQQLSGFTNDQKKRKKQKKASKHAEAISDMIIDKLSEARKKNYQEFTVKEKKAIRQEVKATLLRIHNLIPADNWIDNPNVDYRSENFGNGNAGLGVRKDTFVNIPSGKKRKLHLAEIRSDWTIDKFTKDHEDK